MDFDDLDETEAQILENLELPEPQPFTGTSRYPDEPPLRIGLLSTSSIADAGLLGPTLRSPNSAKIFGIASRDAAQAKAYVEFRGEYMKDVKVFDSYKDLIDSEEIDCVYIPLPNGLHFEWTLRALNAGKHVLCEKPFTSNSEEARILLNVAKEKNLVLMEGQHWVYHPIKSRIMDVLKSGALGVIQEIHFKFTLTMGLKRRVLEEKGTIDPKNFTGKMWILRTEMAGGLTMTLGTYCLNVARVLNEGEPVVTSATPACLADIPELDCEMKAELSFPESDTKCFLDWSGMGPEQFHNELLVKGSTANMATSGLMTNDGPNKITITDIDGKELLVELVDSLRGEDRLTTYDLQLLAFVDSVHDVRKGKCDATSFPNTGDDLVNQMIAIDQIYVAAGLTPRLGPSKISSKVTSKAKS